VRNGQRRAVVDAQIASLAPFFCHQIERGVLELIGGEPGTIAADPPNLLILEIHDVDRHIAERCGSTQIRGDDTQRVITAALGNKADIGGDEITRLAHVGANVIVGILAGVIALRPLGVVIVFVAVVILGVIPPTVFVSGEVVVVDVRILFHRGYPA